MVFTFLALWIITVVLLVSNPKQETIRWAAGITFFGGCGGFARALIEDFLPYLQQYGLMNPDLELIFHRIYSIGSFVNTNGLPYAFLIFSIYYCGMFNHKAQRVCKYVFFVPIAFMLYITPMFPVIKHHYSLLIWWVAPYIVIGCCLLLISYIKEKNPFIKRNRLFTCLMALPPVLFQLFSNYILRVYHYEEAWRLNAVMVSVLLVIFIVLLTKYDFFGIKLKFEKQRLDSTMKSLTSGTTILNHTLKNEIGKINILAEHIHYVTKHSELQEVNEDASTILSSTEHLIDMVNRIQNQTQDIILTKGNHDLSALLEECLAMLQPHSKRSNIRIIKRLEAPLQVTCDKVHFKEVINNLLSNAVEAMSNQGELLIEGHGNSNNVTIVIKDDGIGISKDNIHHVFDPFFTTKNRSNNFGLGLSYCYNVLQKHGGKIEIISERNEGTTVSVSFPVLNVV
jgi:two-component system sporulation sensor kinase B